MELLNHFNITPGQHMSNLWRIVFSYMEIWMVVTEGDLIKLDEFVHLYRLKSLRSTGITNLCLGLGRLGSTLIFRCPSDIGNQGSFLYL